MAYALDHYALRWRDAGHQVIDHIGLDNIPPADIVIVHIDLTVIPEEYVQLINQLPKTLNGNIVDSSRRRFSQLTLSKSDDYKGAVIVKTNANFGGIPEHNLVKRSPGKTVYSWSDTKVLSPSRYPIFKDINSVNPGVWENDNLIVEPFIRNFENGLYYVRYYIFFGDKEFSGRIGSPNPIVKFGNSVVDEEIPLPDEVKRWREELKIDFGRLDYLESEGKYYLIDVNKTEGGGNLNYEYSEELDFLASGLEFYMG
ncbi:MAG: hypothetical protein GY696_01075 [Gammaproteobacteria bacterium]|nr:hypothetical protein [Gammaproteobacteria bacterium]